MIQLLTKHDQDQLEAWWGVCSPSQVITHAELDFLKGAQTITGVSEVHGVVAVDLLVGFKHAMGKQQQVWRKGMRHLQHVRDLLGGVHATVGNAHWGGSVDLSLLSESLGIGFVVFSDQLRCYYIEV